MIKFKGFIQSIMETFAHSIIAFSLMGLLFGDMAKDGSLLFSMGSEGVSYRAIWQIFICSAVIGILKVVLLTDFYFKKTMLLWRAVLMLLLSILSTGICIVVFRWFPFNLWIAWAYYLITITVIILFFITCMFIMTKIKDKKYDKQLSEYKTNQKREGGETL